LQDTIVVSTTEAECMTTIETSKEALWLRELVETLGIIQDSIQVHCNSQSAIHLAKDHIYHSGRSILMWGITRYVNGSWMIRWSKHDEESSWYDDEDHHGGEVQSISELYQGSPKTKWRKELLGGNYVKPRKGKKVRW